ncbi:hypothetical protein [Sulfurimonas sp.]|uniref:hypothetical protein n=1 Tax=Sulfurimonas sp. TaxID=2022749 RepID=UPI002619B95E|nr:hypothetical protein [Sulfurimonas sp.]
MKKTISILVVLEIIILATYFISYAAFINTQVAFLSAFFIILGSSYAYKRMVNSQIKSGNFEDKRDLLDTIEDPHELYDDTPINDAPYEELDLKSIVKEEKAKIKTFTVDSAKYGARGSISAFRLVPYIFLVLGFIALKNNELLSLWYYLPALTVGIIIGSIVSKEVVA